MGLMWISIIPYNLQSLSITMSLWQQTKNIGILNGSCNWYVKSLQSSQNDNQNKRAKYTISNFKYSFSSLSKIQSKHYCINQYDILSIYTSLFIHKSQSILQRRISIIIPGLYNRKWKQNNNLHWYILIVHIRE